MEQDLLADMSSLVIIGKANSVTGPTYKRLAVATVCLTESTRHICLPPAKELEQLAGTEEWLETSWECILLRQHNAFTSADWLE